MPTERLVSMGELSLLRPAVHYIGVSHARQGRQWGPRTIADCQLIYVTSGEARISLGPEEHHLYPRDCIFYGSDSPHWIECHADHVTFYSMHFEWDTPSPSPLPEQVLLANLQSCPKRDLRIPPMTYTVDIGEYGTVKVPHYFRLDGGESLLRLMLREYREREAGYDLVLRSLLARLLTALFRQQTADGAHETAKRKITPALEAVQRSPEAEWTITGLADLCGYHPTYFAEVFKLAMRASPKAYLIAERIRKATSLLLAGETVETTARQVGYASVHYFCRNFKAVTGLTPSQYKRQRIEL